MSTISSALSGTSSSGAASTTTPNYFTGLSSYSQDLQNVISRAVSIASLPIELLTSQQNTVSSQATELNTLDGDFAAIQTAIQNISSALGGSGMNTTVSNPAVASVTAGDGATQGAYTIAVGSIGAYATSLSGGPWGTPADSGGQTGTFNLVIGANTYSFTPADDSAATVASTINAQFGNLVQASAVNVGTAANPDYRVSLQGAKLGATTLDIQAPAGANLQATQSAATGYATSLSYNTWDSSGASAPYTLTVDDATYALTPADDSAESLAAAINSISGNPVVATVVNLGTSDSPDERLQLQATSSATTTVDLLDTWGSSLQQQQTPVAAASTVSQTFATWDSTPDPSGDSIEYTLTLGGATQTFTVDDNSATGVAAAINSLPGFPVTANVVNLGTATSPDYRLQLIDNTGSQSAPQLTRSTAFSMQTQGQPPGSLASYEVANSGKTVQSDSRDVQIAAGVTLTLTGKGTTDVTLTQSVSVLSTALSGFADAYNAAAAELAKQHGQSGGPLEGQSIVSSLSQSLAAMSTYYNPSAGSIGLANLGFTLNVDGTLTYSPLTMMSTDLVNSVGVTGFLGSATGGGFLKAATDAMNQVEAANTGLLKTAETSSQSQITNIGNQISAKQAIVDQLQINLTNQMAQADAALETIEQQYNYMKNMLAAQQTAALQYANE